MLDNNNNTKECEKAEAINVLMEKLDEGENSAKEHGWLSADEVKSIIEK